MPEVLMDLEMKLDLIFVKNVDNGFSSFDLFAFYIIVVLKTG